MNLTQPSGQTQVTAIDILLEPDAVMLRHAEANNARLLEVFPNGFALDAAHRPHITMLQRFARTDDLDRVYGVVAEVLALEDVHGMKLDAFKFYSTSRPAPTVLRASSPGLPLRCSSYRPAWRSP